MQPDRFYVARIAGSWVGSTPHFKLYDPSSSANKMMLGIDPNCCMPANPYTELTIGVS